MIFFLNDSKILFGIGIGLVIGVTLMLGYKSSFNLSDSKIEEKARGLGMHFNDECKAIINEGADK